MSETTRPLAPGPLGITARLAASIAAEGEVSGARAELAGLLVRAPLALRTAAALDSSPLEAEEVTLAWEIARLASPDREVRALGLALAVLEAARSGSTCLADAFSEIGALEELWPAVGPRGSGAPLVVDGSRVALARWTTLEASIATALARRSARALDAAAADEARARVAALREEPLSGPRGHVHLTDEQERAVAAMLTEGTLVLTGGPGTGKTSVVVALLRAVARRGDDVSSVALAAPTGKAADRLGESIRTMLASSTNALDVELAARFSSPTTLHRLLGYRHHDGTFRAHRHNRLAHRLVLVDEVSMIDAALFSHLLDAVAPDATLVLLGDADQLPSVDPGAVLRDLLRARPEGVRFATLTQSHRMDPSDPDGAHILTVARECLEPEPSRASPSFRGPRAGEPFVGRGGAWALPAELLPEALEAWVDRHLLDADVLGPLAAVPAAALGREAAPPEVRRALEHLARARILTVTRRSAEEIDAHVASRLARWWHANGQGRVGSVDRARSRALLPGEPVMVVRNDYDEDLWNGDSGVAFRDVRGETFVSFRRGAGVVTRSLGAVAHLLERAHAVTVHKAQGSEHDEVLVVLPATDTALATREIVYTAITRARRSAIVVGRRELLDLALRRSTARQTGLVEELRAAMPGSS